ncbi:hypothetical protein KQI18_01070 [Clostridioides mangenotii]|uniref:hypothetical protein n=1 Tax=Metaclostridioides mangenotii TaxID=1540 RepID=UPI001C0FFD87|nr:hypothetical protein [Clostridioides mangenotii]
MTATDGNHGRGIAWVASQIGQKSVVDKGENMTTHIFLKAGVGSFAGAIQGYLTHVFGKDRPTTIIVEPSEAACIYKSAKQKS